MTETPYWLLLILAVFWLPLITKCLLRFSIRLLAALVVLLSIPAIAIFLARVFRAEWAERVLLAVGLK